MDSGGPGLTRLGLTRFPGLAGLLGVGAGLRGEVAEGGEAKHEPGSAPEGTLHLDRPAEGDGDPLDHRQAEADARPGPPDAPGANDRTARRLAPAPSSASPRPRSSTARRTAPGSRPAATTTGVPGSLYFRRCPAGYPELGEQRRVDAEERQGRRAVGAEVGAARGGPTSGPICAGTQAARSTTSAWAVRRRRRARARKSSDSTIWLQPDGLAVDLVERLPVFLGRPVLRRMTSTWPSRPASGVRSWCEASPANRRLTLEGRRAAGPSRSLKATRRSSSSSRVPGVGRTRRVRPRSSAGGRGHPRQRRQGVAAEPPAEDRGHATRGRPTARPGPGPAGSAWPRPGPGERPAAITQHRVLDVVLGLVVLGVARGRCRRRSWSRSRRARQPPARAASRRPSRRSGCVGQAAGSQSRGSGVAESDVGRAVDRLLCAVRAPTQRTCSDLGFQAEGQAALVPAPTPGRPARCRPRPPAWPGPLPAARRPGGAR